MYQYTKTLKFKQRITVLCKHLRNKILKKMLVNSVEGGRTVLRPAQNHP